MMMTIMTMMIQTMSSRNSTLSLVLIVWVHLLYETSLLSIFFSMGCGGDGDDDGDDDVST